MLFLIALRIHVSPVDCPGNSTGYHFALLVTLSMAMFGRVAHITGARID